jgi:hypothetical protein
MASLKRIALLALAAVAGAVVGAAGFSVSGIGGSTKEVWVRVFGVTIHYEYGRPGTFEDVSRVWGVIVPGAFAMLGAFVAFAVSKWNPRRGK